MHRHASVAIVRPPPPWGPFINFMAIPKSMPIGSQRQIKVSSRNQSFLDRLAASAFQWLQCYNQRNTTEVQQLSHNVRALGSPPDSGRNSRLPAGTTEVMLWDEQHE